MNSLLVGLLLVLLVPLFVGTWRTSLLGLAAQGLTLAWIASRLDPALDTPLAWLTLVDLAAVRGLLAPWLLYRVLKAHDALPRNDVIPPNLLSWTVALALVLMAFRFAARMVPAAGEQQTLVAVAAAGLLLGFLVLATQPGVFSQIIGVLRIDNAIALFELGGEHHHPSIGMHAAHLLILIATLSLYRWYLESLGLPGPMPDVPTREGLGR